MSFGIKRRVNEIKQYRRMPAISYYFRMSIFAGRRFIDSFSTSVVVFTCCKYLGLIVMSQQIILLCYLQKLTIQLVFLLSTMAEQSFPFKDTCINSVAILHIYCNRYALCYNVQNDALSGLEKKDSVTKTENK